MAEPYAPPLDRLLALGEPRQSGGWFNYASFGIGSKDLPELFRMVDDDALNGADEDSLEVWGPLHAWRAIAQLRSSEAIEFFLSRLAALDPDDWDDWFSDDFPELMAFLGPDALPELAEFLASTNESAHARIDVAHAIGAIGQHHEEERDNCVDILARRLEQAEENGRDVNGHILSALLDLDAAEAASEIESAFERGLIDSTIAGNWRGVQNELQLGPAESGSGYWSSPHSQQSASSLNPRQRAEARRKKAKAQRKKERRK